VHPETLARINIDQQLSDAGWQVQDRLQMNLYAGLGVAVREYPLATGFADYLLFVDRKAVGIIEAKAEGATLSGVAEQAGLYVTGLPQNIPHVMLPLPFQYESTGVETLFRDNRDPQPRSRRIFTFHRPETLAEWAAEAETMRQRVQQFPPLQRAGLWAAQAQAIQNLEQSFAKDQPRALIQMATGSGKTFTAVSAIYRLIKFARARRVLFLVDRSNLARQTYKEFQAYTTPDDGRKFTELYNVQHLQTNAIDPVNKVVITTIQRLYSILSGEADFAGDEEGSLFELGAALEGQAPKEVHYNPRLPVEFFDFIITDECHRSIYNLWRGVLEYFDAFLIGLTATPSKQTLGFFNQNLVMEYSRQRAVADGVNVDGEVYRIRTRISDQGNTVEAGEWVGKRDKLTRAQRLELLDQEFAYDPAALDRAVVAPNQIRTALQTFKERLPSEIFPGRTEVPKTLIFAKDDSHAEDIVHIARQVFGRGDEFCKKITYRVAGVAPEQLISDFRNAYNPRIAVTVDMIATGTDIKPVEILIFMRAVKSRILFEQMLGRGTRVIDETDLRAVNPGEGIRKDHFVIVDMVGIIEQEKVDTQTLERKRSTPFPRLLGLAAAGAIDEEVVSSLAGRLIRLRRDFTQVDQRQVEDLAGAGGLSAIIDGLLTAIDPDQQEAEAARWLAEAQLSGRMPSAPTAEPTEEEMSQAAQRLMEAAVRPLAANPALRNLLIEIQKRHEQVIDESADETTLAAFDEAAAERARGTIASFEAFIEENKDEITALQIIYSIPRIAPQNRASSLPSAPTLTFGALKELAERLQQPPHSWTTEGLWRAYAALERDRVRGVNQRRVLTDLVSLVRHAVQLDEQLEPYPERVTRRYQEWIAAQEAQGRQFSPAQRWWLDKIAAHIGVNLSIRPEDLDGGEFFNRGGRVAAMKALGKDWRVVLEELNEVLA
jgi:type I restriction enzyme R subunit